MSLPWVRLDSNIAGHDKILHLLSDPSAKRWQAAASYMFSLGWAGAAGTDGVIPTAALPFVHGTQTTATLLVSYGLWERVTTGWKIRNFEQRQELAIVTEAKRAAAAAAAKKANCIRWHGPDCGCWKGDLQ